MQCAGQEALSGRVVRGADCFPAPEIDHRTRPRRRECPRANAILSYIPPNISTRGHQPLGLSKRHQRVLRRPYADEGIGLHRSCQQGGGGDDTLSYWSEVSARPRPFGREGTGIVNADEVSCSSLREHRSRQPSKGAPHNALRMVFPRLSQWTE